MKINNSKRNNLSTYNIYREYEAKYGHKVIVDKASFVNVLSRAVEIMEKWCNVFYKYTIKGNFLNFVIKNILFFIIL